MTTPPPYGILLLDDGILAVPLRLIRKINGDLALNFLDDVETRRKLIVKLFTGGYDNEVVQAKMGRILQAVIGRLFA